VILLRGIFALMRWLADIPYFLNDFVDALYATEWMDARCPRCGREYVMRRTRRDLWDVLLKPYPRARTVFTSWPRCWICDDVLIEVV
jgi:hypothetical protein